MVDNRVVEIMWLESKFKMSGHDWATKLVAAAGSDDLNLGSDYNIKYGKKMHRVRLLKIFANEEEAAASMYTDFFSTVLGLAKTISTLSLN